MIYKYLRDEVIWMSELMKLLLEKMQMLKTIFVIHAKQLV